MHKNNFALCSLIFLLLLLETASAVNIGISPGAVAFNKMLRAGYAQRTVTISTSVTEPLTAHCELYGEIKDWLEVDSNITEFTFSAGSPHRMKVIVQPPDNAQAGNYTGSIRIVTDKLGSLGSGTGSVVKAAVSLQIKVEITGQEILSCRAGGFYIPSAEVGFPLMFSYTVANDGNVWLRPHIEIDIWDQAQEELLLSQEFNNDMVRQTEEQRFTNQISASLPVGQYWAQVRAIECGASDLLTFSVLEKGAIADEAELLDIKAKPWVSLGEIVPINAIFRNTGSRTVFATFKGKVSLDDQVIQLLQSAEIQVMPNENVNFTLYFTPKQQGKFIVTGRVQYNRKLTFEKGTVINVLPGKELPSVVEGLRIVPLIVFVILLLFIIILLSKIRKARHRR
ncbi:MAG: hypothetical protein V1837_02760 [Candidatus Woesearchaeota archaeon]